MKEISFITMCACERSEKGMEFFMCNNINIEFNEFINERIENKLTKNKFYKKESLMLEELQNKIYSKGSNEECMNLDNLLNIIFSMKSKEFYTAYQTGFYDGINYNNDMKNN